MRKAPSPAAAGAPKQRLAVYDIARGFSVISMAGFHLCYDLEFLCGMDLAWFAPPLQDIWRASISWTFLFIAGCMCSFSRSNFKRAAKYLAVALAIYVVTAVAAVDAPISFGIIFCMGACTLICAILERLHALPQGPIAAAICLALFLLCLQVPNGSFGIGPWAAPIPHALYETPWLAWLGFPDAYFVSGDYYPVIPFLLMYLVGASCGRWWRHAGYPAWCSRVHARPLQFVGRHALGVYILHQPIMIAVLVLTGLLAL